MNEEERDEVAERMQADADHEYHVAQLAAAHRQGYLEALGDVETELLECANNHGRESRQPPHFHLNLLADVLRKLKSRAGKEGEK